MYAITYKKKSGQLETNEGYEIHEFKVNSSSVTVLTAGGTEKRLSFSSSKCVQIYSGNHNNPLLVLGGK